MKSKLVWSVRLKVVEELGMGRACEWPARVVADFLDAPDPGGRIRE